MSSESTVLDVWSCHFASKTAFEEYIQELPREDLEDPLTEFISDQCQPWYNHEVMEAHFHEDASSDVAQLLRNKHAASESYAAAVGEVYQRLGYGLVNATITMKRGEVRKPRSVLRKAYRVDYLGQFSCKPSA
jgi:LmbE family N-acetylglucosaminyl deacetylase